MKKYFWLSLCLLPAAASAQIGGQTVYDFWKVPISARLLSIGSTNVSTMDDDAAFVTQNPALLTDSMAQRVAVSHSNYLGAARYSFGAYSASLGNYGTASVNVANFSSGDMTAADEFGNQTGTFAAREFALGLAYANTYKKLHYGAALKFINSNLATGYGASSFGVATDVGVAYRSEDKLFGAGLVLKNVGAQLSKYSPNQPSAPSPFEVQIGITNKLRYMPLRFSITGVNLNRFNLIYKDPNAVQQYDLAGNPIKEKNTFADNLFRHFVFGGEFLFGKSFRIRAGYNHQRRMELRPAERGGFTGLSMGVGIRAKYFAFDYGYGAYGTQTGLRAHQFGLILNLYQFMGKAEKPVNSDK